MRDHVRGRGPLAHGLIAPTRPPAYDPGMPRSRLRVPRPALAILVAIGCAAPVAHAQLPVPRSGAATAGDSARPKPVLEQAGSPRAELRTFTQLLRRHDHAAAARQLDLSLVDSTRGPELAERLGAVLAHHFVYDLDALSPLATGDSTDDANMRVEIIGQIRARDGTVAPVRLVREDDPTGRWRFGPATVGRIDRWYDELPNAWARGVIPVRLQHPAILGLQP
jgi:hypothetical protein